MIPLEHFHEAGKALMPDEQININHDDCPFGADTKRRLYIKNGKRGIVAYCHNCGEYGIVPHSPTASMLRTMDELVKDMEETSTEERKAVELPGDVVFSTVRFPLEALMWLNKYEIKDDEVLSHSICYSPSWGRIILPVYDGGKLVFWQGRAVHEGQHPKYISVKGVKKPLFWNLKDDTARTNTILIVEDFLSAIKVSRHCDAVALLGTSADIPSLLERLKYYDKVGIFLDPDQAGILKSYELAKRLNLVFLGTVRRFELPHQPKEMSDEELGKLIRGL